MGALSLRVSMPVLTRGPADAFMSIPPPLQFISLVFRLRLWQNCGRVALDALLPLPAHGSTTGHAQGHLHVAFVALVWFRVALRVAFGGHS